MRCYLFFMFGIVAFTTCTFHSCRDLVDKYYAPNEIKEFEITQCNDTVRGSTIPYHNLSGLSGIEMVDSFLIFLESDHSERIFSVYDMRNDSMIAWFGTIGRAGNELLTVHVTCNFDKANTDILMYLTDDGNLSKVVNLSKSIEENKCHTESSIAHKMRRDCAVTPCDNYVKIGEDKYIARQGISYEDPRDGIFYPPKFLILDKGEQSDIILYPNIIESKAYTLVYVAYSAEVKINPQKNQVG